MILHKELTEKDPIWKIRWELESERVFFGDHVWVPYLMLLIFLKEADLPTDTYNDIVKLYGGYGPRLIPTPCIRVKPPLRVRFKRELYKIYSLYKICWNSLIYKLNKSSKTKKKRGVVYDLDHQQYYITTTEEEIESKSSE